jgi:ATP-dependent DNA helicase RecG
MFDKPEKLIEQIELGEDSRLELKTLRVENAKVLGPHADGMADELVGFANASGGVLVLGIDEASRQPQPLTAEELDLAERWIEAICNDRIKPSLLCRIEKLKLSVSGTTGAVLKIDVPKSIYVHESPNGHFHRVGSSKRRMSTEYIARLVQQRSQTRLVRFDELPAAHAPMEALDQRLWSRFRTPRTQDTDEAFLRKLGLATEAEDGGMHPTVAGILMATPEPRQWVRNAFIQAVAYHGTTSVPDEADKPYQLDARDITGPLDDQVHEACRFVARNMRIGAKKNVGRTDVPQYDLGAVFEALVNAVAHRDYSIDRCKIRLRMYADRLELYSPGAIPNTMGVEALIYRQSSRNETLTSLLAQCPVPEDIEWLETDRKTLMDRRGEGVRIILEKSERLSGKRPEYRLLDEEELLLTIYAAGGIE